MTSGYDWDAALTYEENISGFVRAIRRENRFRQTWFECGCGWHIGMTDRARAFARLRRHLLACESIRQSVGPSS